MMQGTPIYGSSTINDGGVFKEHRDLLLEAVRAGLRRKKEVYTPGANECLQFVLGQHSYLFNPKYITDQMYLQVGADPKSDKPARIPHFKISDNWVAKFLQIVTPYLTQGQVVRTVKAAKPFVPTPSCYGIDPPQLQQMKMSSPGYMQSDPQYQMRQQAAMMKMMMDQIGIQAESERCNSMAAMIEKILNYTAGELGLQKERRCVVEEALTLGYAAYITETIKMPGTNQTLVGSNFVMANDIVWDPDATREKDCKWLAVQCRCPAWLFSRLYGIPEEEIKCNQRSTTSEVYHERLIINQGGEQNNRNSVPPKDEVVYWKFWSRMGVGSRLQTKAERNPLLDQLDERFGDFCFFIVTDSIDYAANLSPMIFQNAMETAAQNKAMAQQAMAAAMIQGQPFDQSQLPPIDPMAIVQQACAWPVPYNMDVDDPWPITTLWFHRRNGSPYPIPHFEFALSYLKFMVWVISFVADKCYRSQRDFWLIDDQVAEQLRTAIENGEDEAIITIKGLDKGGLEAFVKMLEAPEVKKSIMEVYQFFENKVEQMTGLTDLMQANLARSMRTATEAQVVSDASQLRPKDMAQRVNECDTRLSRKEAIASALVYGPNDLLPILGKPGAEAWANLQNKQDPTRVVRETDYDVLASQGRILDLDTRQEQSNKMVQLVLPMMVQLGQATGMFGPANQLLVEWAKANQIDPDLVQFPDMPPPPPAPAKGVASVSKEKSPSQGPQ